MFNYSSTQIKKVPLGRKLLAHLLFAILAITTALTSANAATITGIDFNSQVGGKVQIRLDFDSRPPDPKGYTIEKPARIALDFAGVQSALKQKKHTLDLGNTKSVVVLQSGNRTRMIVNLSQLSTYTTQINNNSMLITVGNDGAQDYLKETRSAVQQVVTSNSKSTIRNIDFRRGENGEGKVVVDLTNANVSVDAKKEGSLIKLVFADTALPRNLARRYDVADFSTPVKFIEAESVNGQTVMSLKPTGKYDYLAYQADNTYVLSVKPLTEEEVKAKQKEFAYVGDKLSLNFQDIEVRAVLQLIADFTDLNLVASDTVTGKITLRLQNVPWDQALDLILKTKGLDKRQEGNVLMVAPALEIAERERQQIETNKQINELAPLQTEFIRVKYASATAIFNLFKGDADEGEGESESTGSILSPRGSVIVDERTNSLLVTETAEKLEEFRRLIKLIDIPIRQVLVEARIVVATSESSEKLGIRWGGTDSNSVNGSDGRILTGNGAAATSASLGVRPTFSDAMAVDLGVSDAGASSLLLGYVKDSQLLALELSAIESNGNGEIVSQPKVITGDKQQATIKSGQQVPFLESSSSGRTTVKFKDVVLQLDVTPHITPDDRVIMDLVINQDSLGGFITGELGSQIPLIDTNELNTQVLVGNGETVVLGGVFRTEDVDSVTKTPFFGDLPYIGRLFRSTNTRKVKTETLIFITPRILAERLVE